MANWSNEAEAREQIKALVAEYYHDFKEKRRISSPATALLMHPACLMKRNVRPDRCNAGFLADHRPLCG